MLAVKYLCAWNAGKNESVVRDTFSCVGLPITLYWSVSDIESEFVFTAPGETLICERRYDSLSIDECWRVRVYPRPPERRLKIELLDTTAQGEMNLIICIWKNEPNSVEGCFPICRIETLKCQSKMEICNGLKDSKDPFAQNTNPAVFCTTIVNNRKCE